MDSGFNEEIQMHLNPSKLLKLRKWTNLPSRKVRHSGSRIIKTLFHLLFNSINPKRLLANLTLTIDSRSPSPIVWAVTAIQTIQLNARIAFSTWKKKWRQEKKSWTTSKKRSSIWNHCKSQTRWHITRPSTSRTSLTAKQRWKITTLFSR